jgi:hypothetical protein
MSTGMVYEALDAVHAHGMEPVRGAIRDPSHKSYSSRKQDGQRDATEWSLIDSPNRSIPSAVPATLES